MKNRSRAAIALTVGAVLAFGPALAAHGASSSITNGSFEADPAGATSITGWSSINSAIDLGVTTIAGCTTVDTSDYSALRDYDDEASGLVDLFFAPVPGLSSDFTYVHTLTGDPISVLGSRLVWNDWEGWYYLEIAAEITDVSEPAYELSSLTTDPPAEEPAPSDPPAEEPAPSDPPAEEPAPSDPPAEEPAPSDPPAEGPAPSDPPADDPVSDNPVEQPSIEPGTADYTYLIEYEWSEEQHAAFDTVEAGFIPDPAERGDDPVNADLDEFAYATRVVTEGTDGPVDSEGDQEDPLEDLGRDGKVLQLYSDMDGDLEGYVIHGPAVYSAPFTVGAGRQINLDWKAVNESDDFHVFGYLLNTQTCAQTEVIDATGEEQDWTTASVAIPSAGTYRFVFVSGTYDQSWGGAAGAFMYIDNIVQTPVFGAPGVDVSLTAGVGDYLPGSDVSISGGGLEPESAYDLVLRSTPVTVTQGTTDLDGRFVQVVSLPDNIAPGAHTITLTGEGPSGPLTEVVYITVGVDGTLLYISREGPQPALAMTGPAENAGLLALAALLTLTGAVAIELERRRRSPFSTVYVR